MSEDKVLSEIEMGLVKALNSVLGAEDRWKGRRERGLTDNDLREAIAYEFGIQGGQSGYGDTLDIAFKGGRNPQFWYGKMVAYGKPTLQGPTLVKTVRRILKIKAPTGQLELSFR